MNSSVDEMKKVVKSDKHEKVKNGKPLKLEKKKAADVAKKHDSVKKEKKSEGGKPSKKTADSDDDDQPLVRTDF